ncbi:MAG: hypothetical protein GW939_01800 [Candidatus Magasanikbacteria bacterium]|nr:hypothetical protein [Candidatus Magasanikbacteria bacterium]
MLSLFRVFTFAIQDVLRNFSLSVMTVFILVLMLLSVNSLLVVRVLTDHAKFSIEDKIDVTIYFDNEANSDEIEEVQSYVKSFPEVVSVKFFGREEVIEQFRQAHQDNPEILASLDELQENPLGATMVVKTRQPSDYQKIISSLQIPEYETIIEAKSFADTEQAIDKINTITTNVERFTLMLSALFTVIAFFIISNTVRVLIYTQRVEISIKKLVGATNWFVQGPYLVAAFLFSVASMVISYSLTLVALGYLDPYISVVFGEELILTNYFILHILLIAGVEFIAVLFLTVMSSLLAMRKHLNV